jgi:hypothetical protein
MELGKSAVYKMKIWELHYEPVYLLLLITKNWRKYTTMKPHHSFRNTLYYSPITYYSSCLYPPSVGCCCFIWCKEHISVTDTLYSVYWLLQVSCECKKWNFRTLLLLWFILEGVCSSWK